MKKCYPWLVAVLVTIVMATPGLASAIQYGGVGGRPAYPQPNNPRTDSIFIYRLKPGQQTTDGVRVINNTNAQQTIAIDAVDSVISSGGGFACAQAADQKIGVGAWLTLQTTTVTLAAGSNQIVPFTLNVPETASVGEHDGCITIQAQSQTAKPSTKSGVLLSFRSAIRVVVTVPGKIVKSLHLISVKVQGQSSGGYLVIPTARNDGNVSLDTNIHVYFDSVVGTTSGSDSGTYPVLPGTEASWNLRLNRPFWGGLYHADATATYNSNPTAELGINQGPSKTVRLSSAIFFAVPSVWACLIYLLILLIIIAVIGLAVRKRSDIKQIRQHWKNYVVKEGDDINSIAKQHATSWRKLVRVNRLRPPYNLRKGQKLKVPPKRKA